LDRMAEIKRNSKKTWWNSPKIVPYLFTAPFVISFLLFYLYPFIATIIMSFQKINGFNDVAFIGVNNYQRLVNEHFGHAVATTSQYTFWTILILIPIPLVLAVLLNSKSAKFKNFFKSSFFMPALTSVIVAGIFFRYSFGEMPTALMNQIAALFGIKPQTWLQGAGTGMMALVILCTWRWLGVNIIYFFSGLQGIPQQLYEAAEIDGANAWQKFLRITFPCLKPVIIYVITISVYGGFAMFAESYAFWKSTYPGDIGMTIVCYIYQMGFNNFDMGFASAIGITLFLMVMAINILQLTGFGFFKRDSD
jgi:arabinosaccharide transport system permease protein